MIHEAKNVESIISNLLKGLEVNVNHKLYNISYKVYENILSVLDSEIKEVIEKPKVKNTPRYGSKTEPKSDLVVITVNGTIYKFSLKTEEGKAYIHTSNSYEDTVLMFTKLYFGNLLSKSEVELIDKIASKYLKKVSNFDDWNSAKGTYSEYVDYKLRDKKYVKWVGLERFQEIKELIKNEYRKLQESGETPYKDFLHEAEPAIQSMLATLMKNTEYAKHLIYEMLTGNEKFGKDSYASANYVVSSDGIFNLDNYNCELVNYKLERYQKNDKVGRLQNVPRHNLSKKIVLNESIETIVQSFPTADMSMKL
jgi:hypothetical protein